MKRAIVALWRYFKGMNSEKDGQVSIKRNMTWGHATLLVAVELLPLFLLPRVTVEQLKLYVTLCKFYAVLDGVIILVMSGVTTIEKLTAAAQQLKFWQTSGSQPPPTTNAEPKPE